MKIYPDLPREFLLRVAHWCAQFNYSQIKYILTALIATLNIVNLNRLLLIAISQTTLESWDLLEKLLDKTFEQIQIRVKEISFPIVPFAGVILCPHKREVGIMDCDNAQAIQNSTEAINKWFYYRINCVQ